MCGLFCVCVYLELTVCHPARTDWTPERSVQEHCTTCCPLAALNSQWGPAMPTLLQTHTWKRVRPCVCIFWSSIINLCVGGAGGTPFLAAVCVLVFTIFPDAYSTAGELGCVCIVAEFHCTRYRETAVILSGTSYLNKQKRIPLSYKILLVFTQW